MDNSRPALVLGGGGRGDLGVVRSLGKAGIAVHLLSTSANSPVACSRFALASHSFPSAAASDEERLQRLHAITCALPSRPLIFTAGDQGLLFLSRCRDEIARMAQLDLAPRHIVDACLEKDAFASIARELNLPVPATWVIASVDELIALSKHLDYPVFVKPTHKQHWQPLVGSAVSNAKGCLVPSAAALIGLFQRLAKHGPPTVLTASMIQELVHGPDDLHYDVHAYRNPPHGVTRAFVGRKLHVFPPHAGVGAFVRSESTPELAATATGILDALDYRGIANMNFKRDARTGTFKLLEINCRYSMWTELPMRAGCNMPVAGYAAMTDQPVPPVTQRDGVAWFDLQRDLQAISVYRGEAGWSWVRYLSSLRTVRCGAFFALDDMKPFFHQVRHRNGG